MNSQAQESQYDYDQSYRYNSHSNQLGGEFDKVLIPRNSKEKPQLDNSDYLAKDNLEGTRNQLLNNFDSPTSKGPLLIKKGTRNNEKYASQVHGVTNLESDRALQKKMAKIKSQNNSFQKDEDLKQQEFESKINLNHVRNDEDNNDQETPYRPNEGQYYELDKVPTNVMKLMQSKTMFGSKNAGLMELENADEEVMDLKLDFDEEPVTQGSVDPLVKVTDKKMEKCIIRHNSKFRIRWDLYIITLVIYNCIQIPLDFAFQDKLDNTSLEIIGYIVDACFIMDIFFNFRTSFINEKTGLEVIHGKTIAKNYLKQWRFWCDLFSVIPFELIYNMIVTDKSGNTTTFKIFDLMKLIRLLRLGRIITYLKFKQDIKIGFRIVLLLAFLLGLVHWVACIWYLIVSESTWMPPKDVNYGVTDFYEIGMWSQYAVVFYYAILLMVGSEIDPTEQDQTIVASLVIILGSITTAFIFGNMAALMASINQKDSKFQEQFDSISNLMRSIQLPLNIQEEVEAYLIHIQQVPDMQQDMHLFLSMLSPSLKSQILFHIYKTIIRKISIFDQCSNIELRFIVNKMKTIIFLPDDEIIRQGDKGSKLYFISRGSCEVWIGPDDQNDQIFEIFKRGKTKNLDDKKSIDESASESPFISKQKLVKELHDGEYFGEIALITHLKRTATVKAKDFTTLAFMLQRNFIQSKEEFPQIYQNFKKQIGQRYNDENFRFRKKMIANVPYFRNLSEIVIQELVYLLRPQRYDPGMLVVKRGDSVDKIFFLKAGTLDIEVPLKNDKMKFDTLNPGSCFCTFSAFHQDKKQKFDFRTQTVCIIETINAQDIMNLQKEILELSDELKTLRVQIENNEKSEFDFFRYVPVRKDTMSKQAEEKRSAIRKKFRLAVATFFKRVKKSRHILQFLNINKNNAENQDLKYNVYDKVLIDDGDDSDDDNERKHFKALYALDQLEKERKDKDMKLKYLQEKCSNPTLFALTALSGKKSLQSLKEQLKLDTEQPILEESSGQDQSPKMDDCSSDCDTIRKDFGIGEQSPTQENQSLSKRSQDKDQNFPKIDGIRKEIERIRHKTNIDNIGNSEINEANPNNNISLPQNIHNISNLQGPDADKAQVVFKEGDVASIKFIGSLNDEIVRSQEQNLAHHEIINENEIVLIDRTYKDSAFKRMKTQNFAQKQGITFSPTAEKKKSIMLDNSKDPKENASKKAKSSVHKQSQKSLNISIGKTSHKRSVNEVEDDSVNLISVLKNINLSLENQQKTMSSLQEEMQKRMRNLEKKLQKAIKVNRKSEDPQQDNYPNQSSSMFPRSTINKKSINITSQEELKEQSKIRSEVENGSLEEKNTDNSSELLQNKKKRLMPMPNQLDAYNSSSIHLISKDISPSKAVFNQSSSSQVQNFQGAPITVSRIQLNQDSQQETNNNQTPYLQTDEYQETIVDKDGPKKIENKTDILNTSNQTNELDNTALGPSFQKTFNKVNPAKIYQQKNLNHPHANINMPKAQSQEDADIFYVKQQFIILNLQMNGNENRGSGSGGPNPSGGNGGAESANFPDNTLILEDQLDRSADRLQPLKEVRDQILKHQSTFNEEDKNIFQQNPSIRDTPQVPSSGVNAQQVNINNIFIPNTFQQLKGTKEIVEAARSNQQSISHRRQNSNKSNKGFGGSYLFTNNSKHQEL